MPAHTAARRSNLGSMFSSFYLYIELFYVIFIDLNKQFMVEVVSLP